MAGAVFVAYQKRSVANFARPGRPGGFRILQTGFFRARKESRTLRSAHRSSKIATRRFASSGARFRRNGWRGARTASFVLRYFSANNDDRLLLVNFGESHVLHPVS